MTRPLAHKITYCGLDSFLTGIENRVFFVSLSDRTICILYVSLFVVSDMNRFRYLICCVLLCCISISCTHEYLISSCWCILNVSDEQFIVSVNFSENLSQTDTIIEHHLHPGSCIWIKLTAPYQRDTTPHFASYEETIDSIVSIYPDAKIDIYGISYDYPGIERRELLASWELKTYFPPFSEKSTDTVERGCYTVYYTTYWPVEELARD